MSFQEPAKRTTARDIQARKGGKPIVMLTAYLKPQELSISIAT
jgi:hypothetical protein